MDKVRPAPGAGPLGLAIFLASLAVLFVAGLVGYWAVRSANPEWAAGLPALPGSLWVSTGLLMVSSVTMHLALRSAKRGEAAAAAYLLATTALGVAFLALQVWAWYALVAQDVTGHTSLYGFTFYLLTGLHAAHVVAGLLPLGVTTWRARAGAYGVDDHQGVLMCAMYWHFLDAVWLVIFANLLIDN